MHDITEIEGFLQDTLDEVTLARQRYPERPTMAVLVEEVGEVARALQDQGRKELYAECVQVAAMAMRIALEGAREYPVSWSADSGRKVSA